MRKDFRKKKKGVVIRPTYSGELSREVNVSSICTTAYKYFWAIPPQKKCRVFP